MCASAKHRAVPPRGHRRGGRRTALGKLRFFGLPATVDQRRRSSGYFPLRQGRATKTSHKKRAISSHHHRHNPSIAHGEGGILVGGPMGEASKENPLITYYDVGSPMSCSLGVLQLHGTWTSPRSPAAVCLPSMAWLLSERSLGRHVHRGVKTGRRGTSTTNRRKQVLGFLLCVSRAARGQRPSYTRLGPPRFGRRARRGYLDVTHIRGMVCQHLFDRVDIPHYRGDVLPSANQLPVGKKRSDKLRPDGGITHILSCRCRAPPGVVAFCKFYGSSACTIGLESMDPLCEETPRPNCECAANFTRWQCERSRRKGFCKLPPQHQQVDFIRSKKERTSSQQGNVSQRCYTLCRRRLFFRRHGQRIKRHRATSFKSTDRRGRSRIRPQRRFTAAARRTRRWGWREQGASNAGASPIAHRGAPTSSTPSFEGGSLRRSFKPQEVAHLVHVPVWPQAESGVQFSTREFVSVQEHWVGRYSLRRWRRHTWKVDCSVLPKYESRLDHMV